MNFNGDKVNVWYVFSNIVYESIGAFEFPRLFVISFRHKVKTAASPCEIYEQHEIVVVNPDDNFCNSGFTGGDKYVLFGNRVCGIIGLTHGVSFSRFIAALTLFLCIRLLHGDGKKSRKTSGWSANDSMEGCFAMQ